MPQASRFCARAVERCVAAMHGQGEQESWGGGVGEESDGIMGLAKNDAIQKIGNRFFYRGFYKSIRPQSVLSEQ